MESLERARLAEQALHRQFVAGLAGDATAYRQFLGALASHLRAFFRRRLARLPDEVEDLVQETLLAVHAGRHTYAPDQPLTAWVHAIARYKLVDFLRAHARHEALHDPLEEAHEVLASADHEAMEARRDLLQVLQALPQRQRELLELVKLGGVSLAEAARATGQTEGAAKVGVHRSLKALAARFRSEP